MKTKEVKRKEAAQRNEAWNKLTPTQQLKMLDKNNLTATKQRAKIAAKLTEKD